MADQLAPQFVGVLSAALADSEFANWLDAILATFVFAPGEIVMASLVVMAQVTAGLQLLPEAEASGVTVDSEI
jgi:hypothetical protein